MIQKLFVLWVLVFLSLQKDVQAAGFVNLLQGAEAVAQANAFVAQADNASAVFYNPAGIVFIKRPQLYTGASVVASKIQYDGPIDEDTVDRIQVPPFLYLSSPINPKVAFGVGFYSLYGLATVWDTNWQGRYITTYSKLTTMVANPAFSLKLAPNLSIGAGFNIIYADLTLRRKLWFGQLGLSDGEQYLNGDDWGYGFNLGLLYRWGKLSLGIAYRSKVHLRFKQAEARFETPSALKAYYPDTKATGGLTLPPMLTGGVALYLFPRTILEFDLTWTGWSTYEEMKIVFQDPLGPPGKSTNVFVQPKDWRDVFAYRFGLRHQWGHYTLLAGYSLDQGPAPSKYRDPQLPDSNRRILAFGLSVQPRENFRLSLAYNYIFTRWAPKENEILSRLPESLRANGDYRIRIHLFTLAVSLYF
ncbi:OmpP1/FadL family transporter [Thermosulfuriphilus sp.]